MKLMIVEDDMLVRLGIKSMVPWNELGIDFVCEARDGEEALEQFRKYLPDISLVDIGLPRMNGLVFIEHAKRIRSDSEFVILTCNQEFEIVRQSLRLGVSDFIIKSTMEIEDLRAVLEKIIATIQSRPLISEQPDRKSQAMQKVFMREWLYGFYTNPNVIEDKLSGFGIVLQSRTLQGWILEMATHERDHCELTPGDLDKIGYAIENIARELYRDLVIGFVENIPRKRWHVLLQSDSVRSEASVLAEAVQKYLGYKIYIGCSGSFTRLESWIEMDREAAEILSLKFYEDKVMVFEQITIFYQLPKEAAVWCKSALKHLSLLQFDELVSSLGDLRNICNSEPRVSPKLVKQMFGDMTVQMSSILDQLQPGTEFIDRHSVEGDTLEDCLQLLKEVIETTRSMLNKGNGTLVNKRLIAAVEHYIEEHISEDMNLNDIANSLNVSPSHLSRIFKKQNKQNFKDYILGIKVKRAQELIKNGLTITEVSNKLGYLNVSSFTRMFKKIKGIAPSHYTDPKTTGSIRKIMTEYDKCNEKMLNIRNEGSIKR
jgi:two-component system response regulator YesN